MAQPKNARPELQRLVCDLVAQGMPVRVVARVLGFNSATLVNYYMRKGGVSLPPGLSDAQWLERMGEAMRERVRRFHAQERRRQGRKQFLSKMKGEAA